MKYRTLGRTGWEVSEIGFGAWGIGRDLWVGADDSQSLAALNRAIDGGLNFVDTALAYGEGRSERLVGEMLEARPERVYVATKVPPRNRRWPAWGNLEEVFPGRHIRESAEQSLRNLRLERIDLLQLHVWNPDWLGEGEWLEELSALKNEGKIRHFGISINDHQPESALEVVRSGLIDTVQVIYNIFEQSPEDRLFPVCLENNVGIIARVPFDEGALTGEITSERRFSKKDWRNRYFKGDRKRQVEERVRALVPLLDQTTSGLPALALKFCLHHPAVGVVIPGMRKPDHVSRNLAVSREAPLSAEQLERLRGHRWEKNFYKPD